VEFLKVDPSKTIYIGFGSVIVQDPDAMSRTIIDAVVKAGVRAIVSKGWSSRGSKKESDALIEFPPCIHLLASVPHDWLFPQVAGVVHHGGAGTTAAGLRFGKPTVFVLADFSNAIADY
jgi:sterol 3beta-glucosyltransferase